MHDVIDKVLTLAERQVGQGTYRGKATLDQAPFVMNCFTFVQWLWQEAGITVPEHMLRWDEAEIIARDDMRPGDLVFTPRLDRTLENDDFGHTGIVGREGWIIHASRLRGMVGSDPPTRFFERGCLGVRRVPVHS